MAVHLTRIYTRTGDDGTTALGDFSRVRKTDVRLAAYADTDEANAAIGVAMTVGGLSEAVRAPLRQVQNDLFDVGADLCSPIVEEPQYPPLRITGEYVTRLEGWCDEFLEGLPTLDSFILPGGTPAGPTCTWPGRSPAARNGRCGPCWTPTPTAPTRSPRPTSTASRTCCSSWAGWRTPTVTSCGAPASRHLVTAGTDQDAWR